MDRSTTNRSGSIYGHMIRGSAWALLMRWGMRSIGIVSIMVLARLLTPEDFGIVAMNAATIGMIHVFSDMGIPMMILREKSLTSKLCHTAWTLQLLQGIAIALVLIAVAPLAVRYFGEPRLLDVVYVAAGMAVITGAESIGMVLVRRELDFAKDFRFNMYKRVIVFVVTIILAIILRDYWALIFGQVCGALGGLALSFGMHSYRPRLSLKHSKRFLIFSLSIIPLSIGRFLVGKVDFLVVGRLSTTALAGSYQVIADLASMTTQEITAPVGRALFPSYAKLLDRPEELSAAFLRVFGSIAMICVPLGLGLSAVADDFVRVLLGDQWIDGVPLLQWLAVLSVAGALNRNMSGSILVVTGHERLSMYAVWCQLAALVPAVLIGGHLNGALGVAQGATVAALLVVPLMAQFLTMAVQLNIGALVRAVSRPLIAGALMVTALELIALDGFGLAAVRLFFDVLIGAAVYAATVFCLWWATGRPAGVEASAVAWLTSKVRGRATS